MCMQISTESKTDYSLYFHNKIAQKPKHNDNASNINKSNDCNLHSTPNYINFFSALRPFFSKLFVFTTGEVNILHNANFIGSYLFSKWK